MSRSAHQPLASSNLIAANAFGWFPNSILESAWRQARAVFPSQSPHFLAPRVYDRDEACQAFLDACNVRHPNGKISGFVIEDHEYRLTRAGPLRVAPVVMRVFHSEASHGR